MLTQRAGDYEIAVAVEEAEGMWERRGGELRWQDPEGENGHVEVCVRDCADGRFVPDLDVTVTLIDPDGTESEPRRQPFLWHPWLYHYGRNWQVPRAGEYGIRVQVAAPTFMRHDHENGRRYLESVEVEFGAVEIERGRKRIEQATGSATGRRPS